MLCFANDPMRLNQLLTVILRAAIAAGFLVGGVYWLAHSAEGWYEQGFRVITSGEKGKDSFSGVLFSTAFIAFGVWEILRLVRNRKT